MADRLQMERCFRIDSKIRTGKFPSRIELADDLEVTERTVQRDITFMKDRFEAPIAVSRQNGGYYYTEPTWFLPAVPLSEGELFSLLIARQAVAQYRGTPIFQTLETVFDKIAGALADKITVHPDYLTGGILSFAPTNVLPVDESVWSTLLQAARSRQTAQIEYSSRKSKETALRTVDPYHIINMQGDWYLFGYDHRHRKICQFQLHRIQKAELLDTVFDISPDFDLKTIVNSSFGSFGSADDLQTIRLCITGDMAELLEDRNFHPQQNVKKRPDGFEISFPVSAAGNRPFYHIIQWILSMGRDVEIIEPSQLKQLVREEIEAMKKNIEKM
ncbi:MAG: WYL domain-containing transcriptional regulator [Kiritimatiellaceae bacterium]|nr:WYL domain-containing transcriptional regulator [Kiritimatiellaceae bacterium]